MRVAVMASGRGSNLEALLHAFPAGHPTVRIVCVVTNRPGCGAIERARQAGVDAHVLPRAEFSSRWEQQAAIAERLAAVEAELIVLAGYDQLLTGALLTPYAGRIINIHPSLLPAFAGTLHAQEAALAYSVKVTGCTVHYVNEEIDGGPIIAQAAVAVLEDDNAASLAQRILIEEHRLLPTAVELIAEGRVKVEGRHVRILRRMA